MTRSLLLARNAVLEAPPPVLTIGRTSRIAFPGSSLGTRKVGIYNLSLFALHRTLLEANLEISAIAFASVHEVDRKITHCLCLESGKI
ncbi:hypothetical protein [Chlorogloeopsis fritschii]|nr:hypothetical protein [Chlorogloeopsis fritschii]